MYTPAQARRVARFMLAWLLLVLGVAVAAPLVQPQALQVVCSATGQMRALVVTDDGQAVPAHSHLDCPLCVPVSAPPPALDIAPVPPVWPRDQWVAVAWRAQDVALALPWQARGPPPPL